MDKTSYALGLNIGGQLGGIITPEMNIADFVAGISDRLSGNEKLTPTEAQELVSAFAKAEQARTEAASKAARADGEAFLAENAQKPGIVTTASGLQYEVISEGTGRKPKATDSVECHYEGTLITGEVFDSSYQRGETATFPLNGVIAGWTEGLQLMSEGAKYRFFIPYNLAYGERGAGAMIPPFAALIFVVELIAIK
ncbi:MAG: FKBP-type peptidyl-prolyl cis-trans isomerase [Bacteroidales bacterium]|nr:FKBP-type peptidyl-prolyl cis-trans isomerase [Bacteroidales bacterium]